jgi:hypothetical protein
VWKGKVIKNKLYRMEKGGCMTIDNFYVVLIFQSVGSFVGAYLGARYLPTLIEGSVGKYIRRGK